jgi:hypothetical protein
MTDDLVKRLRETTHMYQVDCELKMKCADRIEELEAKLEKAVEALEHLVYLQSGNPCTGIKAEKWLCDARITLAELKGQGDE